MVTGRPPHSLNHRSVGFELFVLGRHVAAIEIQEFAAEQADAFGTAVERVGDVARQFDIGVQRDIDAIERRRLGRLETPELRTFELDLTFSQAIFVENARIGVDDQHAARAVDNQVFLVANQLPRIVQAKHRRNAQAARENRGMRGRTADVGDEGGEMMLLVGDDVSRREIVRNDDQIFFLDPLAGTHRHPARLADEFLDHPLDDLADVVAALAQILIFEASRTDLPARPSAAPVPIRRCSDVRESAAWESRQAPGRQESSNAGQ
jgi:hypothetical protein